MRRPSPPPAGAGDGSSGIPWMLLAMFLVVSSNPIAKSLSSDYSVVEVVWGRFIFQALFMLGFYHVRLPEVLITGRLRLQALRSVVHLVFVVLLYGSLSVMPIAETNAILFVTPLIVTLLSAPLLGERAGARRWLAAVVGFVGALVIIRPGQGVLAWAAFLPFAAACFSAFYQLATRELGRTEGIHTTFAYTVVAGAIGSSLLVPFHWVTPDPLAWALMAGMGLLSSAGHLSLVKAFAMSPAPALTPFTFTILIWATLYGFLLFDDLPDRWTILGAAIIVGSALYVYRQERARRRAQEASVPSRDEDERA